MNLVTGATGLLGSHVLIELTKRNQRVRAAFRNPQKITAVEQLFHYYLKEDATEKWQLIEWVQADLLDLDDLKNLVQGSSHIYHCAALVSFFKADFEACIQQNRYVTANLVDLAIKYGVAHFCHVSSTAAIGGKAPLINENTKWDEGGQHSGYGVSKRMAEKEVWRGIEEGLKAVIVNPCVILGPAAPGSPSLQMLQTAQKGVPFYTSGFNSVVDARDVAWAMVRLVQEGITAERFLVVGPQQTFKELFSTFAQKVGRKAPYLAAPKTLTLFFAAFHELWCHISGKRNGLTIETARSAHEVLKYARNKIENQLSFKYNPLENIIQNMIDGQSFIEKKLKKLSRKLIIFIGIFYLVGIIGMTIGSYKSFFVELSFFHLLLSFGTLLVGRKNYGSHFWLFLFLAFSTGMLVEWIGVHTGYLFGNYTYGAVLGPKMLGVPLIIGVNWAMLSIVSAALIATLKLPYWMEVILASSLMVFLDFLMEPVAIKLGFWNWKNNSIPIYNYVCWFFTALFLQFFYRKWRLNEANNVAVALFIYMTIFFTILNIRL